MVQKETVFENSYSLRKLILLSVLRATMYYYVRRIIISFEATTVLHSRATLTLTGALHYEDKQTKSAHSIIQ